VNYVYVQHYLIFKFLTNRCQFVNELRFSNVTV